MAAKDDVADAVRDTLSSPNELDSNGEAANAVDGLFAIARAINRLAEAAERLAAEVALKEAR